jgi:hypothetical protein
VRGLLPARASAQSGVRADCGQGHVRLAIRAVGDAMDGVRVGVWAVGLPVRAAPGAGATVSGVRRVASGVRGGRRGYISRFVLGSCTVPLPPYGKRRVSPLLQLL